MKKAMFSVFIPLEMGDIIQGQKSDIQYEIIDIQYTYSLKQLDVINVSLFLKDVVTGLESKVPYDFDIWEIIKENRG